MSLKNKTININKLFSIIIIFLLIHFLDNFQLFKKTFLLLSRDYDQRMQDQHGYCSKESVGFINYIQKKYNFKKTPYVINFEEVPNSYWSFFEFNQEIRDRKFNYDYVIILNYTEDLLTKKNINNKFKIDLEKYKIIEKNKNCYLLNLK